MKFLTLIFTLLALLPLLPTACGGGRGKNQFTRTDELDDMPFQEDVESRLRKRGGSGGERTEADTVIDLIVSGKQVGADCPDCGKKVDLHFYIGGVSWTKPSFWHSMSNAFPSCRDKFVRHILQKGFLSHLKSLDWRFSHSLFSAGPGQIGDLERDGKRAKEPNCASKSACPTATVLNKNFAFYEDVFAYTLARAVEHGRGPLYGHHIISPQRDRTIQYDAPEYIPGIHKGGLDNPLPGLDDILTNKYGAVRPGSRVEIFVMTDYFPSYSEEEVDSFIGKYKGVRFHLLSSHSQSGFLGSLRDMVEKSGGAAKQLCSNKNIGLELAEIVLH